MRIEDFVKMGEEATGGRTKLAAHLDLRPNQITDAKRQGIPVASCYALAKLIGEDPAKVIAASEFVTEKRPARRAMLAPFVQHAAVVSLTVAVTLLLSPTTANAAQVLKDAARALCIM